ncbi:MAG TPA: proton-conducting transporter membrane subunit [Kiritimatiellia bacterium]|nr:proton-conducting transporter membrane subunit [Kiritimatiellia bacterium]
MAGVYSCPLFVYLAMPLEGIYLFGLLAGALALLAASGVGSLLAGRWSERWAVGIGAGGAGLACGAGLAAAVGALLRRVDLTVARPWRMPYGEFRLGLDPLSAFFLIPLFLLSGLAALYAIGYFRSWKGRNPGRFWLFYNGLVASMALVVAARNGVLFLAAWEIMTMASFFLVIFDEADSRSAHAGWIYLVATHLGTALLIGLFVLLGRAAGSQDFGTYAAPAGMAGGLFLLGLAGFGTKAGLYPLHVWLPEAHPAAPSPVSAVMSGVMIKTGIYGIVRLLAILGTVPGWCAWLVLGIGAASGILGVLFALAQHDLKRLLAYHSVENIGIIALGIGLGMLGMTLGRPGLAALGFAGGLLHVLNHAIFKGLLFLGAGAVTHATGTRNIDLLGGALKRMPWTGATFLIGSVAICGLPPLNGFVSEFLIFVGAIEGIIGGDAAVLGGAVVLVSLALVGGLAAACFTKAFGIVFLGEPRSGMAAMASEVGLSMRLPMLALAGLCGVFGLLMARGVRWMEPVVGLLAGGMSPAEAAPGAVRALVPIALFGLLAALVLAVAALAGIRRRLLAGHAGRETVTWDCGYAAPTASMQYTATGFAQPLTQAARGILRPQIESKLPSGVYPAASAYRSETPDMASQLFFDPLFRRAAWRMGQLRWLQQGRVHWYVFYIVLVLLLLLGWALWA